MASVPTETAPAKLSLTLEGLRAPRGSVRVCLWSSGKGFPDCKANEDVRRLAVPATATRVTVDVTNLEPGEYGVSVIHDENDNRRLDKAFIGLPREGVGFSNNASAPFGPPKFARVAFPVSGETTANIRMRYYL
ncbi:MAG: DUF2141 domain-containing protein [Pacificimonas sp.]